MRLIAASFILVGAAALGSLAAPAVSKKGAAAPAKAAAKSGVKRGAGKAAADKRTVGKRVVRRRVPDHYSYVGQQRPAPERIQEIERALVEKGYLAGEPDGNWDQASTDALRRFQQSQNLYADGRLSSMSLIALGLGSRQNGVVPAPAAVVPVAPDTVRAVAVPEPPAVTVAGPLIPPPPSSAPLPLPVSTPPRVAPSPAPPLPFTPAVVAARPAAPVVVVVAPPPAAPSVVNKPAPSPAPGKNMPLVTPDTSVPAN